MESPVLNVIDLRTEFTTRRGRVCAVDDVSFSVCRGEVLGIVGESGSGKSMTGFSIMGLIDRPGQVVGGRIELRDGEGRDVDLRSLDERGMRRIRGNRIAMIFQDPMMTLNPVLRVETQMVETIRAHENVSREVARMRSLEALKRVGIPAPEQRMRLYPHQFSGGMRQRVVIAIALLNRPDVIIADEATTALDVTIQGQILFEMQKICRESGTALIWITHDLSVLAGLADRVSVMYAGMIVESGTTRQILESPMHPYTRGLVASTPSANVRGLPLKQIPGTAPALIDLPQGCAFQARCEKRTIACEAPPPLVPAGHGQQACVRCFNPWVYREGQAS